MRDPREPARAPTAGLPPRGASRSRRGSASAGQPCGRGWRQARLRSGAALPPRGSSGTRHATARPPGAASRRRRRTPGASPAPPAGYRHQPRADPASRRRRA